MGVGGSLASLKDKVAAAEQPDKRVPQSRARAPQRLGRNQTHPIWSSSRTMRTPADRRLYRLVRRLVDIDRGAIKAVEVPGRGFLRSQALAQSKRAFARAVAALFAPSGNFKMLIGSADFPTSAKKLIWF